MQDQIVLLGIGFAVGIVLTLVLMLPQWSASLRRARGRWERVEAALRAELEAARTKVAHRITRPAAEMDGWRRRAEKAEHELDLKTAALAEAEARAGRLDHRFQALRSAILDDTDTLQLLAGQTLGASAAPSPPPAPAPQPAEPAPAEDNTRAEENTAKDLAGSKADHFAAIAAATEALRSLLQGDETALQETPSPPAPGESPEPTDGAPTVVAPTTPRRREPAAPDALAEVRSELTKLQPPQADR